MTVDRPGPRKLPQQERSRALFDAILEASAELLEAQRPDFTLAAAAERAGVSPGSLYQYFPDRDALVGALIDRQIQRDTELLAEFRRAAQSFSGDVAALLVDGILGMYGSRPRLMVHMLALMQKVRRDADLRAVSTAFQLEVTRLLARQRPEQSASELETMVEVALFSLLGTVRQLAMTRPHELASEALRDRLIEMTRQALV